jgi:predicted NAD/FAD-binding protein|tara:strand:+ start:956 stop:1261 length:306 start_codon:yes stop_codon:yes gene_type:complete
MTDFTAYKTPILAVACPDCLAPAGSWCKRPSGHKAMNLHKSRLTRSDEVFIDQHGEDATITRSPEGWLITEGSSRDLHPIEKSSASSKTRSDPPSQKEGDQ